MKKLMRLFFLLPLIIFCSATEDEYTLINSIAFTQPAYLTTDKLGHAYVLVENQVLQFDAKGKPLANYSENNFGVIRSIDPSNPMKIMIFYSDFARLVMLDSKLAYQSSIDLRSLQINQPLTVCNSGENGYWIYDREDDQLKKIDMNLQVVHRSGTLLQSIGYQVQPGMMTEESGYIYMNNPESGILVFDRYGEYYKTIPYPKLATFQVIGNEVLFIKENKLMRYNIKTLDAKEVLLPSAGAVVNARIEQHELYLLTTDSLKFYSF
jgi:hypothetical protein